MDKGLKTSIITSIVSAVTGAMVAGIASWLSHFCESKNIGNWAVAFFLQKQYSLLFVIGACVAIVAIAHFVFGIIKDPTGIEKAHRERMRRKFEKNCTKSVALGNGYVISFDVHFSIYDGLPFGSNLILHCPRENQDIVLKDCYQCTFLSGECYGVNCIFTDPQQYMLTLRERIKSCLTTEWNKFRQR